MSEYDHEKESARFLIKLGFRNDYIQEHYFHDDCYQDYTFDDILNHVGPMWFSQVLKRALERRGNFTFKQLLIAVGLKDETAKHLDEVTREIQTGYCYTYEQLFDLCLKYLLGHYDELLPGSSYIIEGLPIDRWIHDAVEATRYLPKHAMFNCVNVDVIARATVRYFEIGKNSEHIIVFHATNWKGYTSIKNNGILTQFLRGCLDFGFTSSFYVALDTKTAIGWIEKHRNIWKSETCIMVFVIPKTVITGTNKFRSKEFEQANDEWTHLTTHSRRCIERNSMDDYDFIYGPMVANANGVRHRNETAVPHKAVKYQLAVKQQANRDAFTYLQQRFVGCIVLKK